MNKNLLKPSLLAAAALFLAGGAVSTPANAVLNPQAPTVHVDALKGYICQFSYSPAGDIYLATDTGTFGGMYGAIQGHIFTQPKCTGSYLGTFLICSTGATGLNCQSRAQYTEAAVMMTMQNLAMSQANDERLDVEIVTLVSNSSAQVVGTTIAYRAD
jgi:hypothetical protein